MSEEPTATLLEILKEVVAITENPEIPYVAFFDYSGHVEVVTVRVYREDTDWSGTDKQNAGKVFRFDGYADSAEDVARMGSVLQYLRRFAADTRDKKSPHSLGANYGG